MPPHLGGIKAGPAMAAVLYLLLLVSAALALLGRRMPGRVPERLAEASPWLFLVFVLLFAAYRMVLVRARKYPAAKAFFQIGAGFLFFMLLMTGGQESFRAAPSNELGQLLRDQDPRVRLLAAEVAGYRQARDQAQNLVQALEDPDESVRQAAHDALVKLHGADLGPVTEPSAVKAWRDAFP